VLSRQGARAHLRIEAQDPFDAASNAVNGEIDVTICE